MINRTYNNLVHVDDNSGNITKITTEFNVMFVSCYSDIRQGIVSYVRYKLLNRDLKHIEVQDKEMDKFISDMGDVFIDYMTDKKYCNDNTPEVIIPKMKIVYHKNRKSYSVAFDTVNTVKRNITDYYEYLERLRDFVKEHRN